MNRRYKGLGRQVRQCQRLVARQRMIVRQGHPQDFVGEGNHLYSGTPLQNGHPCQAEIRATGSNFEKRSRWRQAHTPSLANEKTETKRGFHLGNLPAQCRLRHEKTRRGNREAAAFGDGQEIANLLEAKHAEK
jgi:hypothetical protein